MVDHAEKEARRQAFDMMTSKQKRAWEMKKAWENIRSPEFNAALVERARKRMARVDEMEPEIRALVYEFGLEIVQEYLQHRVDHAPNIAFLIKTVLRAERPHSVAVRKLFASRGVRATSILFLIDTTLGADYENGQRRFRFNSGPNRRLGTLDHDDDDEAYFVIGPAVTSPVTP